MFKACGLAIACLLVLPGLPLGQHRLRLNLPNRNAATSLSDLTEEQLAPSIAIARSITMHSTAVADNHAGTYNSSSFPNIISMYTRWIVPQAFGAKGDLVITGNSNSIASGSVVLTSSIPIFNCAKDVGKSIYIPKAGGSSKITLISTIASCQSRMRVTLATAASSTASRVVIAYGHDDTAAIQSAYDTAAIAHCGLQLPPGKYLHHGLNFTGSDVPINGTGAELYAIDVTNVPHTGVDLSGRSNTSIVGVSFMGGFIASAPDVAPYVNVLAARVGGAGEGDLFAIEHAFTNVRFVTVGNYDMVLYGYEQTDFDNCEWYGAPNGTKSLLYLSAVNTPRFQSPYQRVVAPPTSMTLVSIRGAKSVFSCGNSNAVVLDEGATESVYAITIEDAYINETGCTFLSDTASPTATNALRYINLVRVYGEAQRLSRDVMVYIRAPAWDWTIAAQFYAMSGLSRSPYTFTHGILDSYVHIDSTGNSTEIELTSSSCLGSILQLGQQEPAASCSDYALLTQVGRAARFNGQPKPRQSYDSINKECGATVILASGQATIHNACITGTRPVLCTDQTAAAPVQCKPSPGVLAIKGTKSDRIAWGQF